MNEEEIKHVAQKILELLAKAKIPTQGLSVIVDVPASYLKSIITNFPVRRRSVGDIAVTVSQENWDITVGLAIFPKKKGNSGQESDTLESKESNKTADSEGGQMDERRAREIALKIRAILEESGLEVAGFQVLVTVPTEFYESIKHHFSRRSDSDQHALVKWDHYTFGFKHYGPRSLERGESTGGRCRENVAAG